jgi:hypothetical protein
MQAANASAAVMRITAYWRLSNAIAKLTSSPMPPSSACSLREATVSAARFLSVCNILL